MSARIGSGRFFNTARRHQAGPRPGQMARAMGPGTSQGLPFPAHCAHLRETDCGLREPSVCDNGPNADGIRKPPLTDEPRRPFARQSYRLRNRDLSQVRGAAATTGQLVQSLPRTCLLGVRCLLCVGRLERAQAPVSCNCCRGSLLLPHPVLSPAWGRCRIDVSGVPSHQLVFGLLRDCWHRSRRPLLAACGRRTGRFLRHQAH